jgi:hypothetical protein
MALALSFDAAKRVCNRVCGRARLENPAGVRKSQMNMRQIAINIMRATPHSPMEEVVQKIAGAIGRPLSEARAYYRWIVQQGLAPGTLLSGQSVYVYKYTGNTNYDDAVRQLSEYLKMLPTGAVDPDAVSQLMRDCSNYDAIGEKANGGRISSATLKKYNKRVSQKAINFMKECSGFDEWHRGTIKRYFQENPVCTVLTSEDQLLNIQHRATGTGEKRYSAAGNRDCKTQFLPKRHVGLAKYIIPAPTRPIRMGPDRASVAGIRRASKPPPEPAQRNFWMR